MVGNVGLIVVDTLVLVMTRGVLVVILLHGTIPRVQGTVEVVVILIRLIVLLHLVLAHGLDGLLIFRLIVLLHPVLAHGLDGLLIEAVLQCLGDDVGLVGVQVVVSVFYVLGDVADVVVGLVLGEVLGEVSELHLVHEEVVAATTQVVVDIGGTLVAVVLAQVASLGLVLGGHRHLGGVNLLEL